MVNIALSVGDQYDLNIFVPVENILHALNVTKLEGTQLILRYVCVMLVSFHVFSKIAI